MFMTDGEWDDFAYQDVIAQCYELSLVQTFNINGSQTTFTLHPLIADWLRLRKALDVRWNTLQEASGALTSLITDNIDYNKSMDNRYPFDYRTSWKIVYYIDYCIKEETVFRASDGKKYLRAEDLEAFAHMYWAVDKFPETNKLLSRVVEIHTVERGKEDLLTVQATFYLAVVKKGVDELENAIDLFSQVLEAREKALGAKDKSTLEIRYQLGVIHHRRGDYALSIDALQTCVDAVESGTIESSNTSDWYVNLGGVLGRTRRIAEAEAALRKSLKMCIEAGNDARVERVWPMRWLTKLLCTTGRTAEAESLLKTAFPKEVEQFGPNTWEANFVDEQFARVAWTRGELASAKKTYEACLETYMRQYNNFDIYEVLGATTALGDIHRQQGAISEAHRLSLSAADGYERMCGVGSPTTLEPLGILLEVAIEEKDTHTLEQTLARIELIMKRTFDLKALYVLNLQVQICRAYQFLGKRDIARTHLEDAVSGFAEILGDEHSKTREVQSELSRFRAADEN